NRSTSPSTTRWPSSGARTTPASTRSSASSTTRRKTRATSKPASTDAEGARRPFQEIVMPRRASLLTLTVLVLSGSVHPDPLRPPAARAPRQGPGGLPVLAAALRRKLPRRFGVLRRPRQADVAGLREGSRGGQAARQTAGRSEGRFDVEVGGRPLRDGGN